MIVDADGEQADRRLLLAHDNRHGGRDHVCRIRPDQKINFVDGKRASGRCRGRSKNCSDRRNRRARPAGPSKPALGVDVVAPYLVGPIRHLPCRSAATPPVSAMLNPTLIGAPDCATAKPQPKTIAAAAPIILRAQEANVVAMIFSQLMTDALFRFMFFARGGRCSRKLS